MTLNPAFHDLSTFRLAGLRRWHTLADASSTVPLQWQEFHQLDLPGRKEARITFGATAQMDGPNQRFEYLAGYEVPDFEGIPAEGRMIVPAAHYAVFPLETVAEIPLFWQHFGEWLSASGHKSANSPNFERYDERYDPAVLGPLEAWVPISR